MKLNFLSFEFDKFAAEMANLKKKGFDYLITIVGEDFGAEEGLGCVYILENTKTHERCSVKMMAKSSVCGDGIASNGTGETDGQVISYIPTVSNVWSVADLLEREVYDFYGIVFLGHPDMRRLFLRSDFKGYPFLKDWKYNDSIRWKMTTSPTTVWNISSTRTASCSRSKTSCSTPMTMSSTSARSTQPPTVCFVCRPCLKARS